MNHIKKLESNINTYAQAISELESELIAFKTYLSSPKFYKDPTIQVRDVFNRLATIENAYKDRLLCLEN